MDSRAWPPPSGAPDSINVNVVCPLAGRPLWKARPTPTPLRPTCTCPPWATTATWRPRIGRVVVQLASPDFKFMSGETLTLEGRHGLTAVILRLFTNICSLKWPINLESGAYLLAGKTRIVLGIDPGLAHTGWGIVEQCGPRLSCVAYGCVATPASQPLAERLMKIHRQIGAVVERFRPECVGIGRFGSARRLGRLHHGHEARGKAAHGPVPRAALPWASIPRAR